VSITPISLAGASLPATSTEAVRPTTGGSAPFANLVDRFLSGAAQSHGQATTAVQDLALGRTDNLHGVLLQVAQADLSFRLVLEIRNRLMEAYQEIQKMQV